MSSDKLATVIGRQVEKILYEEPLDQYLTDTWESLTAAIELMDKNCDIRDVSTTFKALLEQHFLRKVLRINPDTRGGVPGEDAEDEEDGNAELDEPIVAGEIIEDEEISDENEDEDENSEADVDPDNMSQLQRARYYGKEIMAMRENGAVVSEIMEKYNIGEGAFYKLRKEILG